MNLRFYRYRKLYYAISIVTILIGVASLFAQGLNQGVDFKSGTLIDLSFEQDSVAMEQVRDVLSFFDLESSSITQDGEGTYVIKTVELSEETQSLILDSFEETIGAFTVKRIDSVGPIVGRELTRNGLIALVVALALMMVYVTVRFEWRFAVSAIVCLLHDAFVMLGFFSLMQYEVDSSFIAAILTIVGYSINDTIVFFDRVRENTKLHPKWELEEMVDTSIRQTLMRATNLYITFALVLLPMIFLGGETTKSFAIALLAGNTAGYYSTAFIAVNLWADLKPQSISRR